MYHRFCITALGIVAAAAIAHSVLAQGGTPVVGPRKVVTYGPRYDLGQPPVVNEPNIIATTVGEDVVFVCSWQVGDVPGVNETEAPVRLEYSIGAVYRNIQNPNDPLNGRITWGPARAMPMPSSALDARDPALAVFGKDVGQPDQFAGFGVFTNNSIDEESFALEARTLVGSDLLINPFSLEPQQVAWIRGGAERSNFGGGIGDFDLYVIGRSLEETQFIDFGQLILRRTTDGGDHWTPWQGLEIATDVPALGFPTDFASHGVGDLLVGYMDWKTDGSNEVYLRAMNGVWNLQTVNFGGLSLNRTTNLTLGGAPDYFTAAKNYIAGDFEVGPFAGIAVGLGPQAQTTAYIVYHDITGSPQGGDADFDVYIQRGVWNGVDDFNWDQQPVKINQSTAHVRSDQFMPTICVDGHGRIHVAWYDTRDDLKRPGQDVKIALYYAHLVDQGDGSFQITELVADQKAIDTAYLRNKKSIGDRIDIVPRLKGTDLRDGVVIVYTGSAHSVQTSGGGAQQQNGGFQFDTDEIIYSRRIDFNTP